MAPALPITPHFDDPGHWHQRAQEARALAEQMSEEQTKKIMLRIADNYGERRCALSVKRRN